MGRLESGFLESVVCREAERAQVLLNRPVAASTKFQANVRWSYVSTLLSESFGCGSNVIKRDAWAASSRGRFFVHGWLSPSGTSRTCHV